MFIDMVQMLNEYHRLNIVLVTHDHTAQALGWDFLGLYLLGSNLVFLLFQHTLAKWEYPNLFYVEFCHSSPRIALSASPP